jgi:hypothetical protein
MKQKLSELVLILVIPAVMFSQSSSTERLAEMKNSFALGLEDKGLEIASELMSRDEFKDVRAETVFFIAEYHFSNALMLAEHKDQSYSANISYTYYLVYKNDYPKSKYSSIVDKRLKQLISNENQFGILKDLFDYYFTEASIVSNNIWFTNKLFIVDRPYPYLFFFDNDDEETNAIQILERYYDDIIVNHPDFEIQGYYWKIISNLSVLTGIDYFKDGLMVFKVDKVPYKSEFGTIRESDKIDILKETVLEWLTYLNSKYPNNPITLDLNLIFVNIFMIKDDDTYDAMTKTRLEFVVQNELDKTHPRYMLAKEFLLNNKFEDD